MDTIYDYDVDLKKNVFYGRFHPEYLPYIGKNYSKTKILLLGESNYVDKEYLSAEVIQLINSTAWYATDSRDEEKLPYDRCIEWCDNREIIKYTFEGKKNGTSVSKAHNMYINPAKAFLEVFPKIGHPWVAFSYFASMNYFQKPTTEKGQSFEPTIEDNLFAADNLRQVVNVLQPETIIFLSKKAHWAFEAHKPAELNELYIDACAHPTCAWWNRDNGKHGREKFKTIITERVTIV